MLTYVSAAWLQEHLDSPEILVLDPRSPLRYMAGHPKGAVNAPIAKARDASGALQPLADLERWLGSLGLDDARKPVIYDQADGRNAAMLAWILLHLGREDVHLMESVWETWVSAKREIFYRPVVPVAREFHAHPRPQFRATIEQVTARDGACLLDFRSADEFSGKVDTTGRPGHIPGAINIDWRALAGRDGSILAGDERLREVFEPARIAKEQKVIAYCQVGVRAALGFLALSKLGLPVALYDNSYAEWAKSGQPVEALEPKVKTENA